MERQYKKPTLEQELIVKLDHALQAEKIIEFGLGLVEKGDFAYKFDPESCTFNPAALRGVRRVIFSLMCDIEQ